MNSPDRWFNHVNRKALLRVLGFLAVLLTVVGGVRWGLGYSPTLDVAVGTFFDVVGILVALTAAGVAVYNVVDFVGSRYQRRKYYRIMATGRKRRLAAAAAPAIEPARLVVVTEQMTCGDQALEPEPVDLDQLPTRARP